MYYIGLDVHKKTISYCVKDASGQVHREGTIGATRRELDLWIQTLPQPRIMAIEATIFTGWIYDHLLPHAEQVKVAHPLMLREIAQRKRRTIGSMLDKIAGGVHPSSGTNGERSFFSPRMEQLAALAARHARRRRGRLPYLDAMTANA